MRRISPINDNITSRVIPGLTSEYRIVSLPYWAWFWLDDFMVRNRISYQGILDTFGCDGDVNSTLRNIAELHQDQCMRGVYKLANDNEFLENKTPQVFNKRKKKVYSRERANMPRVYKLFGFMACATTLDSVWSRRNYDERNQIN